MSSKRTSSAIGEEDSIESVSVHSDDRTSDAGAEEIENAGEDALEEDAEQHVKSHGFNLDTKVSEADKLWSMADSAFYNPFSKTTPFALVEIDRKPEGLTRKRVALMRHYYKRHHLAGKGIEDDGGAQRRYDEVITNFPLHFARALKSGEQVVRILDLTWLDFSLPMLANATTGEAGTWSTFIVRPRYLLGTAQRVYEWLWSRRIIPYILPHASVFPQPALDDSPRVDYDLLTVQHTKMPASCPGLGTWIAMATKAKPSPVAIMFVNVFE